MYRFTRTVIGIAVAASVIIMSCNDGSNPSSPSTSINRSDLTGNWVLAKDIEAEPGQAPDTENYTDESDFFKFTESKIYNYVNNDICYGIDSLSTLTGSKFHAEAEDADYTLTISGNQIIFSMSEGGYSYSRYYTKYSGTTVPPSNWPTTKCSGDIYKKKVR